MRLTPEDETCANVVFLTHRKCLSTNLEVALSISENLDACSMHSIHNSYKQSAGFGGRN
jgi:hypothetical protein